MEVLAERSSSGVFSLCRLVTQDILQELRSVRCIVNETLRDTNHRRLANRMLRH